MNRTLCAATCSLVAACTPEQELRPPRAVPVVVEPVPVPDAPCYAIRTPADGRADLVAETYALDEEGRILGYVFDDGPGPHGFRADTTRDARHRITAIDLVADDGQDEHWRYVWDDDARTVDVYARDDGAHRRHRAYDENGRLTLDAEPGRALVYEDGRVVEVQELVADGVLHVEARSHDALGRLVHAEIVRVVDDVAEPAFTSYEAVFGPDGDVARVAIDDGSWRWDEQRTYEGPQLRAVLTDLDRDGVYEGRARYVAESDGRGEVSVYEELDGASGAWTLALRVVSDGLLTVEETYAEGDGTFVAETSTVTRTCDVVERMDDDGSYVSARPPRP